MSTAVEAVVGRRLADEIDDILRAAIALGASDEVAIGAAIARLEQFHHAPLTRQYMAMARRTYGDLVPKLRAGVMPVQRERGIA